MGLHRGDVEQAALPEQAAAHGHADGIENQGDEGEGQLEDPLLHALEGLVEAIGNEKMTLDNVAASISQYNEAADGGEDPLGKAPELFERLGGVNPESEYYIAVTGAPYIYSTCGGVEVNEDMQVLDESGNAIAGLYAVGTDSMGVMFTNTKGYTNYGGVAQGYAFFSGKTAGAHAAAQE